jgi:mycothiol synthase
MDDPVNLELPPGLTSRPAIPADARSIFELVAACERESDGVAEVDAEDITMSFQRHGFDPALDSVLVYDHDELVGWTELYRWRAEADVRPSHRGRGLGSGLLRWAEARGRSNADGEAI